MQFDIIGSLLLIGVLNTAASIIIGIQTLRRSTNIFNNIAGERITIRAFEVRVGNHNKYLFSLLESQLLLCCKKRHCELHFKFFIQE